MNFQNFDLNLLRVFDVLMEEENVSRAAVRLGVTQSSASNALNRLRNLCGDQLLERSGNMMVPTRVASDMWPQIRSALRQMETSLHAIDEFEPFHLNSSTRIGIDPYSLTTMGYQFLSRLSEEAPNLKVSFINADPHLTEAALRDGDLDLIIGPVWKSTPGLQRQVLFREKFVGLAGKSHPLLKAKTPISVDAYLKYPHLLFSEKGLATGNVDFALKPLGLTRSVAITVPSYTLAAEVLESTNFIINLGKRISKKLTLRYAIGTFEIPIDVPGFDVAVLWASRNTSSKLHVWMREKIAIAANGL